MDKTYFSYFPQEIFSNILVYLDISSLAPIIKTFSLRTVKYHDIWKYMLQFSYSKNVILDIINSKLPETIAYPMSNSDFQSLYTWPDIYQNMLNCYPYIQVIKDENLPLESIHTHYIILNHLFSMSKITFQDGVKIYYRNNINSIKDVNYNFLFRFIFFKMFPKEYLLLMNYANNIKWHNLYPNLIAIIRNKVDGDVKISNLWNIILNDYNKNKDKWKNYPEIAYLCSILDKD